MSDPNRKAEKAESLAMQLAAYSTETKGLEFSEWPKISRLNRDIVITEKIDGTNAAVGVTTEGRVYGQSRNRIVTAGNDNYGFGAGVAKHADVLREVLGEGLHFGEWWGVGIARGYGLSERRFSLFNTAKWGTPDVADAFADAILRGVALHVVPVLYAGPWHIPGAQSSVFAPDHMLDRLREGGSWAAPGFDRPEGVVVYHTAGKLMFKATIERDDEWKGKR